MKKIIFIFVSVFFIQIGIAQTSSIDYYGQTTPGTTPVKFANGTISKSNIHGRFVMSADGKEIYWTTLNLSTFATQILCVKYSGGQWSQPTAPSFAVSGMTKNPVFSKDGNKLFFDYKGTGDTSWSTKYIEKTDTGWTTPKNDGVLLKTSSSFTSAGKVYYSDTMGSRGTYGGIYSAQFGENGYSDILAMCTEINGSSSVDYTPYISPDESYLMFSSSRPLTVEQFGKMFIYISFKTNDNTWTTPVKMFTLSGRFPSISPDAKYLFFCGDDLNIYWVDIKVVEQFRPTSSAVIENKNEEIAVYPNPSNNKFTLSFGKSPIGSTVVEIYNVGGNLVFTHVSQNSAVANIDLTGYPSGIYFMKTAIDKQIVFRKLCLN